MKPLSCLLAVVLFGGILFASQPAQAANLGGGAYCCTPCCPPPPVCVSFCAVDPCTCCSYQVSVCVPACCAGEVPCLIASRKGLFGRKILTYCFKSCGKTVQVVITRRGKVTVR